jgi:hypothetical protein
LASSRSRPTCARAATRSPSRKASTRACCSRRSTGPDNKQFREFYTSQAAIDAAKKGQPLPNGTVITMVQWKAKLDAQGNPEKGADGRFMKGDLNGYAVMEKRTGWGAEYDEKIRNGEWEYQAFTPAKAVNANAKLTACFECHKPLPSGQDFVFLYGKMAGK